MAPHSKPGLSGWYVDLDGKKSGPYDVEKIRELLVAKRIQADSRVCTEAELPREGEAAGERTSNRLLRVGELLDQYTDPALSLLDALQAARSRRKGYQVRSVQNAVAEERNSPSPTDSPSSRKTGRASRGVTNPDRKSGISPQLAIFVATALVAITVVWGTVEFLRHSANILPPGQNQAAKGAEGIKTESPGEPTEGGVARAHPPSMAPATPPQLSVPIGGAAFSRNHSRAFQRPLASVPNTGRPAPAETSAANEKDEREAADLKEQKEREAREARESRESKEAQDTGGGGGQPIDGDPGVSPPPGGPVDPNTVNSGSGAAQPMPPEAPDPNLSGN